MIPHLDLWRKFGFFAREHHVLATNLRPSFSLLYFSVTADAPLLDMPRPLFLLPILSH